MNIFQGVVDYYKTSRRFGRWLFTLTTVATTLIVLNYLPLPNIDEGRGDGTVDTIVTAMAILLGFNFTVSTVLLTVDETGAIERMKKSHEGGRLLKCRPVTFHQMVAIRMAHSASLQLLLLAIDIYHMMFPTTIPQQALYCINAAALQHILFVNFQAIAVLYYAAFGSGRKASSN